MPKTGSKKPKLLSQSNEKLFNKTKKTSRYVRKPSTYWDIPSAGLQMKQRHRYGCIVVSAVKVYVVFQKCKGIIKMF
jgi:hypothetical protein